MTGKAKTGLSGAGVDQKLPELVERLKQTFAEQLISTVLYGSAATGDWNENTSDLNVLCVLSELSPRELGLAEPIVRWWREAGNPPPLLLTAEEVRTSTDCFPMEFQDMRQHRRVLYGADVLRDLPIENKFYRAEVEHELRSKQLRLRQRSAEVLSQPERLAKLMADSISTFCVLGRHALVLSGRPPRWIKQEVVDALSEAVGHPLSGMNEILAVRSSSKGGPKAGTILLLGNYLADIATLVHFVDALE